MSKTNKSRKVLVLAGIVIMAFAAKGGATPIFSVSVNNVGSSQHEITVSPGGAFSVDLNVTTNEDLIDLLVTLEASESGVFDITGGLYHSPWNVSTVPIPVGGLDPQSQHNLIGSPGIYNTVGPGNSKFCTLDLLVDSSAFLGTYIINVNPVYSSVDPIMIPGFYVGGSGPDFAVNVIPEPSTFVLLGVGLIGMLSYRKRKKQPQ